MDSNSPYRVSEIWIYPIKSLGGIRLSEVAVEERGLQYDRRWMLVDESGKFVTQRNHGRLTFFEVSLRAHGLEISDRLDKAGQGLRVPFVPATTVEVEVTVWDSRVTARMVSAEANGWFSEKLGFPVRLVHMGERSHRKVDERYASNGEEVSFADGYPILLISQASLDNLNERLAVPVKMHRFRPNLVISGTAPFEEDSWREIRAGTAEMRIVKPCSRCVMVTIDPDTGEKSPEPLKTLVTFRQEGNEVLFGQNVLVRTEGGIRVGDQLTVY